MDSLSVPILPVSDSPPEAFEPDPCPVCHEPRNMLLEILGCVKSVPITCLCVRNELEKQDQKKQEARQRKLAEAYRQWGMEDTAWRRHTFATNDLRDRKATAQASRYVRHFEQMKDKNIGLMLYGAVGSGKTYLAACIANALADRGYTVLMTHLSALINHMTVDYGRDRQLWLDRISQADLLILDDFGVERASAFLSEQAYEVLNARYKSAKPLIVTSNLRPDDITRVEGLAAKRIHDRIREGCTPVLVSGDSRRGDIARDKAQALKNLLGC